MTRVIQYSYSFCMVVMLSTSAMAQDARFFWVTDNGNPADFPSGATVINVVQGGAQVCMEIFVQSLTGADFESVGSELVFRNGVSFSGGGTLQADCPTAAIDTTNLHDCGNWAVRLVNPPDNCASGTMDRLRFIHAASAPGATCTVPAIGGLYVAEVCFDVSFDATGSAVLVIDPNAPGSFDVVSLGDANGSPLPNGVIFSPLEIQVVECDPIVPPGFDCWKTKCGASRFDFCDTPIPADFFDLGSAPFDGVVFLGGTGEGDSDTSVQRLEEICLGIVGSSVQIQIELMALSLRSCEPIVVQTSGQPVEWNVRVDVSNAAPPPGSMSITKTHDNGGTFTAEFFVQPVFTFSRVGDANKVRILDTAAEGIPPALMQTVGLAPWVYRLSEGSKVFVCGQDFVPGVEEDPVTLEQCCRKIGHAGPGHIHETAPPNCSLCPSGACCLADGVCQVVDPSGPQTAREVCETNLAGQYKGDGTNCNDTDGDGIPDVLETHDCSSCITRDACNTGTDPNNPDTDGDGCLDGAELATGTGPCNECDPIFPCQGPVEDCNGNGIEDKCDIASGASKDCNGNGIPDQCDPGACCIDGVNCAVSSLAKCELANGVFLGPCKDCPEQNAVIIPEPGGTVFVHVIGPPVECPPPDGGFLSLAGGCVPPPAAAEGSLALLGGCVPPPAAAGQLCKFDPWVSSATGAMAHTFGVEGSPGIPAGFFGEGSDEFTGSVPLEGVPVNFIHPTLGKNVFGDTDTVIRRTADPFDRCDLPSATPADPVAIEVVALSLKSVNPITVTFNDEASSEQWDVAVDLSATVTPPPGSLTATKVDCNGGTYTSVLNVQPRFTFTKVGANPPGPNNVKVLDTGTAGLPHISLDQNEAAGWVGDIDESFGLLGDPCSDFHAGISTSAAIAGAASPCDCNGNGRRDKCDLEPGGLSLDCNGNAVPDECDTNPVGGTSLDCNNNGIPDECEADCNGNGVPDDCDVDANDPDGNGQVSADCNINGIPDECEADCQPNGVPDDCDVDVSDPDGNGQVSADCNSNGIPDECEPDCDGNGQPDGCDISANPSRDCDNDGILDACVSGFCCDVSDCNDVDVCTFDQCLNFRCSNTPSIYADVDHDGDIDLFDLFCILNGFSGDFSACSFKDDDLEPCAGDGDIDLFDLFAVLNAFGGDDPCCGGLP